LRKLEFLKNNPKPFENLDGYPSGRTLWLFRGALSLRTAKGLVKFPVKIGQYELGNLRASVSHEDQYTQEKLIG
jgi:hypothetical protein